MEKQNKIHIIITVLGILALFVILEIMDNVRYDQHEEDCTSEESFQEKSWITGVGECVPSAEAEFCKKVMQCVDK